MTIKEAWQRLEDAQQHLERFLEAHGGTLNQELGGYSFIAPGQTKEFGGLNAATQCISDAQGYLEDLIEPKK